MVKEAEEHAAEDNKRREEQYLKNGAEQLVYQTEKLIKDNEEKLPEDVKGEVQADVDALKTALAGEDFDAIKSANEKLLASQQKLGESIYANVSEEATSEEDSTKGEDVVDAEVVEDEESPEDTGEKK
jgi:molecular chaperone DnaK